MPKLVDHQARREAIAHALWRIVDEQGWARASMREVSRQAGVSLGQLQHYFSSRREMLICTVEFAAERTARRIAQEIEALGRSPHPRDVLRAVLVEQLPLRPDARATSRVHAAYVLEALHDPQLHEPVAAGLREGRMMVERLIREAIDSGHIPSDRDPAIETDLIMALTGIAPLLELDIIEARAAVVAIDQHLDRLFAPAA